MTPATSNERKRLTVLLALLGIAIVVAVLRWPSEGVLGVGGSEEAVTYERRTVPRLAARIQPRLDQGGGGRNPFAYGAPPVTPTPVVTPAPTLPPRPSPTPRPTPTPRTIRGEGGDLLPPPRPFDREFIGYLGPEARRVATFRGDDGIEVVPEGGVIDDYYIVRSIGLESVRIGFVGYPRGEDVRIPIAQ